MVFVEAAGITAAERGLLFRAVAAEVLQIGFERPVPQLVGFLPVLLAALVHIVAIHDHVMVARQDGVGHLGVLQHLHRGAGHLPLVRLALLVDHVAQVRQERDVQGGGMLRHPAGLGLERLAAVLAHELLVLGIGGVARVELRVRQHRQGEGRRERGLRLRLRLGRDRIIVIVAAAVAARQQQAAADGQQGRPDAGAQQAAPRGVERDGQVGALLRGDDWGLGGVLLPCFMNATWKS